MVKQLKENTMSRHRESRILVVANETSEGAELLDAIVGRVGPQSQVMVVAPALNSRIRHWMSDVDPARDRAELRLARCIEQLRVNDIDAWGEVGDSDPMLAIDDALKTFGADELVISTHPEDLSNWLARGIVARARNYFGLPVTHVEATGDRAIVLAVAA
jgi:hypothetical protein